MLLLLAWTLQEAAIDAIVEKRVAKDGPGAAVLVMKDGKSVFQKGYGLANVEHAVPITPRTVFELASVSKQFTAMGILILHDRGELSVDDDARKILPKLPAYDPKRPILIRDLLCHTSGLVDYLTLLDKQPGDPDKLKNEDVLKILAGRKLLHPTGTKWDYSNSNYCLLALVIERVTKSSFGAFLRREIFAPLGMEKTTVFDDARAVIKNRAYGYARTKNGLAYAHTDYVMTGDGCVMTSLEDWVRWEGELREPKLVKVETLARAFTSGKLDDGTEHGYGFGWSVGVQRGRRLLSHGGGWAGVSTYVGRWPDEGLTVVVLSNLESFGAEAVAGRIARVMLQDQPEVYPEFHLPNIEGGMGRLSDFRGKKTLVVNFASW